MHLSRYQFQLLKYLYRHPYVDYATLTRAYSPKYIWKIRIPRRFNPISTNRPRLDLALSHFDFDGITELTPARNSEEDTGHRYAKGTIPTEHMHIVLSELGTAIVEERLQKFWGFALPYTITTAIAISSLIAQFIK